MRRHLATESSEFQAVGEWLDSEYDEPRVREILQHKVEVYRARDVGQPTPPNQRRIPESGYLYPALPGDGLRADRLEQAFKALHVPNQGGDFLRPLGGNLPRKEREMHALRVVVVCACLVDPDAAEWLASVTPLASCPWRGDLSVTPRVKGRAEVTESWAYEALALLAEAIHLLGWESPTQRSVATSHISSVPDSPESLGRSQPVEQDLNPTEQAIVDALRECGGRLTTGPLLTKALGVVNSNGKATLASLVKRGIIDNRKDARPRGYGLPEWSSDDPDHGQDHGQD